MSPRKIMTILVALTCLTGVAAADELIDFENDGEIPDSIEVLNEDQGEWRITQDSYEGDYALQFFADGQNGGDPSYIRITEDVSLEDEISFWGLGSEFTAGAMVIELRDEDRDTWITYGLDTVPGDGNANFGAVVDGSDISKQYVDGKDFLAEGQYHKFIIEDIDTDNDEITLAFEDDDGATGSETFSTPADFDPGEVRFYSRDSNPSQERHNLDNIRYTKGVVPPEIENTSVEPENPANHLSFDAFADVTDEDGNVTDVNLTLYRETDGSNETLFNGSMSEAGGDSYELLDVYELGKTVEQYYIEFYAEDNDGNTETEVIGFESRDALDAFLESPSDGTSVLNPVDFQFYGECYDIDCVDANLLVNESGSLDDVKSQEFENASSNRINYEFDNEDLPAWYNWSYEVTTDYGNIPVGSNRSVEVEPEDEPDDGDDDDDDDDGDDDEEPTEPEDRALLGFIWFSLLENATGLEGESAELVTAMFVAIFFGALASYLGNSLVGVMAFTFGLILMALEQYVPGWVVFVIAIIGIGLILTRSKDFI